MAQHLLLARGLAVQNRLGLDRRLLKKEIPDESFAREDEVTLIDGGSRIAVSSSSGAARLGT
jgi:hypothetical protein